MARTFILIAVAAPLMSMFAALEATGQEKRGKNHTSEAASKWVATAGDRFFLDLYGTGDIRLVFTTDKKAVAGRTTAKFFRITTKEAASIVQALVDCGMWSRSDTLPELHFGRYLSVGSGDGRDLRAWRLGDRSDDISSMVIIQHLLKSSKGERQQALKGWLSHGQGTEKK